VDDDAARNREALATFRTGTWTILTSWARGIGLDVRARAPHERRDRPDNRLDDQDWRYP
jgi:hypothetical protein